MYMFSFQNLEMQHSSILMLGYVIGQHLRQTSDPQAMEQEGLKEIYDAMQKALKKLGKFKTLFSFVYQVCLEVGIWL